MDGDIKCSANIFGRLITQLTAELLPTFRWFLASPGAMIRWLKAHFGHRGVERRKCFRENLTLEFMSQANVLDGVLDSPTSPNNCAVFKIADY